MPDQNKPGQPAASPFEIVTPGKSKKTGNKGIIVAVVIVVFLILSVVAGVLLVRQQQNIQEKASEVCAPGYTTTHLRECKKNCSNEQAPGDPWYWINATKGDGCGTGTDGTAKFYCDIDECNQTVATATPSATPTITPTPSATPAPNTCNGTCTSDSSCASGLICSGNLCRNPLCTSAADCICLSATPTATPVPTQAVQSTPLPIPVTGVDWPTVTGIGVGAAAIIISILIAL